MKYDMKKIMARAWEIARTRAENYDGNPREYLHATLRYAWAEAKVHFELPALTGSEKQIAWAEQIRSRVVKEMTKYIAGTYRCNVPFRRLLPVQIIEGCKSKIDWLNEMNCSCQSGQITGEAYNAELVALATKAITACTSAAWYIDHFKTSRCA